jgi:hypothetical protein
MSRELPHPGWATTLVEAARISPGEGVVVVDEPLLEQGSQLVAPVRRSRRNE